MGLVPHWTVLYTAVVFHKNLKFPGDRMYWMKNSAVVFWGAAWLWALSAVVPVSGMAAEAIQLDELIRSADKAVEKNELEKAQGLFAQILEQDPKNWRVMYSLAQLKFETKKFKEAQVLTKKILAMPVSNGRHVLVFYPDSKEGEEAELVDEIVLPPQRTKNNMRNYLDIKGNAPIPHYRLFFKSTGKMELVPQKLVRIEYQGVLHTVYNEVQEFAIKVDRAIIAEGSSVGQGEVVPVKGGCFKMGNENGTPLEKPVHEVCLKDFDIDKYEVTQAQYQTVMEDNPSQMVGADRPVENVTWFEADKYCSKVNRRLPTEAEWEYAARGNTDTQFYWGNTVKGTEANFCDVNCSLNIRVTSVDDGYAKTAPVGKFPPNPLGLHDMAGNVAEWVNDWWDPNYYRNSPKDNPQGPRPLDHKVIRGGGWHNTAGFIRTSHRTGFWPQFRSDGLGFRCASK